MLTSHQQSNDHSIILALPQHLPFKRHLPVFPGSHQDPHYLVRDPNISVKQPSKRDAGLSVWVWISHSPDNVAHVSYLAVDVLLGTFGSLCSFGSLLGASVTVLTLLDAEGHGVIIVEIFTEGVQFLVDGVLRGPVLPAVLEVSHSAVFLGEGVDLVGILSFLFVPEKEVRLCYK